MREDGAACSNLMESDRSPQGLRKAPREDGASSSDPSDGPGMRFAFVIHPISEQTKNLMDLDRDGRLRRTWGRADLLRFCAEAHDVLEATSRPMKDGQSKGPRIVDTFAGLVSSTGARAEGRLYEIPMERRLSSWSRPSRMPSAGGRGLSGSAR